MAEFSAGMLLRQVDAEALRTGPEVGERMPDFTLPDHRGVLVNYSRARRGRRALLHFFRSTVW